MQIWGDNGFCGDFSCEGCDECGLRSGADIILSEEEFYDVLSLASFAPDGIHPSIEAELARINRALNGDEEDEDD